MSVLVWDLVVSDLIACHFVSHDCWLLFCVAVSNLLSLRVTFRLITASAWLISDWSSNTSWAEPIAAIIQGRDFGRFITIFLDPRGYVIVLIFSVAVFPTCNLNVCPGVILPKRKFVMFFAQSFISMTHLGKGVKRIFSIRGAAERRHMEPTHTWNFLQGFYFHTWYCRYCAV